MPTRSHDSSASGPRVFATPDDLFGAVGEEVGVSEWMIVDQERIDRFAEATGDHQWIHVDPVRAAEGPFGSTIAHGYLTLAATNKFMPEILRVEGISMGINYGVNKVRFPHPVAVDSRIRGRATITSCEEIEGGVQVVITMYVEVDGIDRPACVCETVSRFMR